ncbi:O-antigen ligase family protein [Patescibacteria group bacterium]|nr:O-antigen ligase family protein [Patescibacteria group bacterium]
MRKFFTSLNIIFGLEIIVVALAAAGLIPREAILVWTGIAIFYMIFSPVRDSLWLVVASIPLAVALPVNDAFDTLANWRILIVVLFLVWLVKEIKIYCSSPSTSLCYAQDKLESRTEKKYFSMNSLRSFTRSLMRGDESDYLAIAAIIFLLITALSIGVADYKILAIKKLLFLINIFLLFLITRNLTRDKEAILKVWQAAAIGGITAIAVALVQFSVILFVPLIDFWQFWASRVIGFFYGQNLADLLSYSNTWFAYYQSAPPTLRLFSVFPDSHSFAMFSLISVPIFLSLAFYYRRKKQFFWIMAGLALLGAVFSGSRGVWISALPVAAIAIYFWLKETDKERLKKAIFSLMIFIFIFLFSTIYPPIFYKIQDWQTGQYSSSTISFFERARSISDLDEMSNKGRLEIWRNSLTSIAQKPILGVGLGNFVSVINESASAAKKGASAHNLYLDIASEVGVLGLLILLLMFIDILRTAWLVWRRSQEPHFKFFGLLFGLYFIWILGYSFFDVVLLNDKVLLLFMVSAATLYSLRNISCDPEKI